MITCVKKIISDDRKIWRRILSKGEKIKRVILAEVIKPYLAEAVRNEPHTHQIIADDV